MDPNASLGQRRPRFVGVLAALLLCTQVLAPTGARAGEAAVDCDGVAAWIDALEDVDTSVDLSPGNDWALNAQRLDLIVDQLEAIAPPPAAAELHDRVVAAFVDWGHYYDLLSDNLLLVANGQYEPDLVAAALPLIRRAMEGNVAAIVDITALSVRCGVPVNLPGQSTVPRAALVAPPPCGGTAAWLPLIETAVEGFWGPVVKIHREITEGRPAGNFGQLASRWDALYGWSLSNAMVLAAQPTPPATAELHRQLLEALTRFADAFATSLLEVTAFAMWSFAKISNPFDLELHAELEALVTELGQEALVTLEAADGRYQNAVVTWNVLAGQCRVDSTLPTSPLPPPV